MELTVRRQEDGTFAIVRGDSVVAAPFSSHAAAWKALDRINNEVVSPSEKRSDWAWQQAQDRSK